MAIFILTELILISIVIFGLIDRNKLNIEISRLNTEIVQLNETIKQLENSQLDECIDSNYKEDDDDHNDHEQPEDKQNNSLENDVTNSCLEEINIPISDYDDEDSHFYDSFKYRIQTVDKEFVVNKSELANLFKQYDDIYEGKFNTYYIDINNKLYCTFAGINYIKTLRRIANVKNDIVNNRLIIELAIDNPYTGLPMSLVA